MKLNYPAVILVYLFAMFMLLGVAVSPAFAHVEPPPKDPPPLVTADCSPGYYKNHPDDWDDGLCECEGDAISGSGSCNDIFIDLNARGRGCGTIRGEAADFLNACFVTAESSPCTDD